VLGQDFPALEAIWSADFMVNTPGNLVSPNRSAVLNVFRQGIAHYSSYEQTIEQIRIEGDLAIVMGGEMVKPIGNAPLAGQTVQRRFTHLWKKENGQWRLTARHANNVFPPPM
jgi:ketosteroid isomerase-like protein